ncbi:protein HOTHEAD-like isoform X2 [Quercus lobata]|uniref:protein HOTHEAD-like isoform X2 n=1 Tax=Quercus lobata TaxID=97700 RepID=UPI0012472E17|nr:protein HOTHEAD-like isoform X2 [Quercus lobata]
MGSQCYSFTGAILVGILMFHGFVHAEKAPNYTFVREATSAPTITYYDYIIIGGGTSGCPLAATLSQNARVLVLERGGSPYGNPNITNIENFSDTLSDTSPTSPTQQFTSEDGVYNARARVLGGGTALNGGFYSHASTRYVKEAGWDKTLVNKSYEWVEKLVVFKPPKVEYQVAVRDSLLEAGVLPYNGFTYDHLNGTKIGGTIFDKKGHRHTAADLLEYADPRKITVYLHATVYKIFFRNRKTTSLWCGFQRCIESVSQSILNEELEFND